MSPTSPLALLHPVVLAQAGTEEPGELVAATLDVTAAVLTIVIAGAIALASHVVLVRLVFGWRHRRAKPDRLTQELREHCRWPARLTSTLLGAQIGRRVAELGPEVDGLVAQLITIAIIVAVSWWAIEAAEATEIAIRAGNDLERPDNRHARQAVTRVVILRRAATVLVVIVAAAGVLLTFDGARAVGASLLASAGIISIIAGVAAQSTLGNLVAGIQVAFTQVLKLDDVVVIEGEWGNVEAIGLTNVVVRTWDRRRIVLPTSYFVGTPFQNWTREATSQIIGPIVWHLDHHTDVAAMRAAFHDVVEASDRWDGDVCVLQVVDTATTTIQVRGLASAVDAGTAWDLRCEVREAMLAWLVANQPDALPRLRVADTES